MLLFRSEEHASRWREPRGLQPGGLLTLEQIWGMADAWYRNRMARDWRRFSLDEAQALFTELGLTSDFWRLAGR